MIDFKLLAKRLSEPWWGPQPPTAYTMVRAGQKLGVGIIVGQDYGAWNLALLARGSFVVPSTRDEHSILVSQFVLAKQAAAVEVKGQPLGSYTMLMGLHEFRAYLLVCSIPEALRKLLGEQANTLIASTLREGV